MVKQFSFECFVYLLLGDKLWPWVSDYANELTLYNKEDLNKFIKTSQYITKGQYITVIRFKLPLYLQ